LVKRWLGHSRLATTEIYSQAIGNEEAQLAAKHWALFRL
jgi:integrase/recombinase XerD